MITPQTVETRLHELGTEIDQAHEDLVKAEKFYHSAKAVFEIAIARARIKIGTSNMKLRVGDVADKALLECESEWVDLQTAEAMVKAARANSNRVRTQVDIARSIGTSVRASMEA
jgi:outer membrane protein TolC